MRKSVLAVLFTALAFVAVPAGVSAESKGTPEIRQCLMGKEEDGTKADLVIVLWDENGVKDAPEIVLSWDSEDGEEQNLETKKICADDEYQQFYRCSFELPGEDAVLNVTVSAENEEGVSVEETFTFEVAEGLVNGEHIHLEVIDEAVQPDCTEEGKTEGLHCGECGLVLIPQVRPEI